LLWFGGEVELLRELGHGSEVVFILRAALWFLSVVSASPRSKAVNPLIHPVQICRAIS